MLSPEAAQRVQDKANALLIELWSRLVGQTFSPKTDEGGEGSPYWFVSQPAVCRVRSIYQPPTVELMGLWSEWRLGASPINRSLSTAQEELSLHRLDEVLPAVELHNLFRNTFLGTELALTFAQPQLIFKTGKPFTEEAAPKAIAGQAPFLLLHGKSVWLRPPNDATQPENQPAWSSLSVRVDGLQIVFCTDPDKPHFGPDSFAYELSDIDPHDSPMLVLKVGAQATPVLTVLNINRMERTVEILPHKGIQPDLSGMKP